MDVVVYPMHLKQTVTGLVGERCNMLSCLNYACTIIYYAALYRRTYYKRNNMNLENILILVTHINWLCAILQQVWRRDQTPTEHGYMHMLMSRKRERERKYGYQTWKIEARAHAKNDDNVLWEKLHFMDKKAYLNLAIG